MTNHDVTNVVIAGLGGQGVLRASDILADAAFLAGLDVKKAEVHGMSQRGGSVSTDVRFGEGVLSPMVPVGEADYLVVLESTQIDNNRHVLSEDGTLIGPDAVDATALPNARSLNVALLGVLSNRLPIGVEHLRRAVEENFPEKLHAPNFEALEIGRKAAGG